MKNSSLLKWGIISAALLGLMYVALIKGCCELGFTCIMVGIAGDPPLKDADIYINGKLVGTSVDDVFFTDFSRGKRYEIKVVQKGFKPLTTVFQSKPGDREAMRLLVRLEPLDSVPPTPTSQTDTAKSGK